MVVLLWASALAVAGPLPGTGGGHIADASVDTATPPAPDVAEYHRLSGELEKLVSRNAWAGVERTFQDLLATGMSPSYGDWMRGAESARLRGDMQEVYVRLTAAKDCSEDNRPAVEWLWELDRSYGTVFVACDPGSNLVLESEQTPFDPDQARAIAFAQEQVRERCFFEGRLPEGTYHFYTHTIAVRPKLQSTYVDLRGTVFARRERRDLKHAWAEQAASSTEGAVAR